MSYDFCIIGGGPAGIFSAIKLAKDGKSVILIEKNSELGIKLLITGKGRCNITNSEPDFREFISKYGNNGKFLFSSFSKFNNSDIVSFFEENGLKTQNERGNRIFPETGNAKNVLQILKINLKKYKVEVLKNSPVLEIVKKNNKIEKIILKNKKEISAENFVIATGGKSYPLTGSTGDGYDFAKKLGHKIIDPKPALCPIILKENIKELEGLSLKNVNISIYSENKKLIDSFGEAIFTRDGMSGPIILDMSENISTYLDNNLNVKLRIDFKPALDFKKLDERILRDFGKLNNKDFKNSLDKLLPQKLIPFVIKKSGIDPDKKVNAVTKEERMRIMHLLKECEFNISKLDGFQKAIITSGGIDLKEIDPKNMKSKIIDNLYFAGEVLDINGPTGGYNLQICWTTANSIN
jgi:predicted Rossmann fold flavoprotein